MNERRAGLLAKEKALTRYQVLDLVPSGRNESALEWPMEWVKRHDEYAAK